MNQPAPLPDDRSDADDVIARHRDELKKRFPLQPSSPKKPKRRSTKTLSIALLALSVGGGLVWLNPAYKTEQFSTPLGQRQTIDWKTAV